VFAEFGDDKARYTDARGRKNYAGTSPITRQPGKKKIVLARYVHNDRLLYALGQRLREHHRRHDGLVVAESDPAGLAWTVAAIGCVRYSP
jgi:hypothetical protein